jgi:conserved hypothetical protein TIGR01213
VNLTAKRDALTEERELCDHCLGRQFAQLGHGLENYERGAIARQNNELSQGDFDPGRVPESAEPGGTCDVCQGVFEELDHWTELVVSSMERYGANTFLLGIRPPSEAVEAEEQLWESYGAMDAETMKTELSRLIGKRIENRTNLTVEFKRPDLNPVLDMNHDRVELQVNSLLIYGQYNKHSREIPQTVWHCRKCRGDGCEQCDWTGKNYPTSVQEEIQPPFMRETEAIEAKFHGGGREDVDARCLGKREFVLELVEPLHRDLDLEELQEEVNQSDKVEVFGLRPADKDEIEEIKEKHADKTYRAYVETGEPPEDLELEKLKELKGEVEQRTPERVEHRRADKTRRREVLDVDWGVDDGQLVLEITAEAGTYIKELVSSDEGRTQPSVAGLLSTEAEVDLLDVTWIEK